MRVCSGCDLCWFAILLHKPRERLNGNHASCSICESTMTVVVSPVALTAIYRDGKEGMGRSQTADWRSGLWTVLFCQTISWSIQYHQVVAGLVLSGWESAFRGYSTTSTILVFLSFSPPIKNTGNIDMQPRTWHHIRPDGAGLRAPENQASDAPPGLFSPLPIPAITYPSTPHQCYKLNCRY